MRERIDSISDKLGKVADRIDRSGFGPYLRGAAHILDLGGTLYPSIPPSRPMDLLHDAWRSAAEEITGEITKSPLAMTARDYAEIGTPPQNLTDNPDKTRGDLMSDDQILAYLKSNQDSIEKVTKNRDNDFFAESDLIFFTKVQKLTIEHLDRINRLPDEFKPQPESQS